MEYNYEVTYTVYEADQIYKTETIGIRDKKPFTPTQIKSVLRLNLPVEKRKLFISINSVEEISEEESVRRFGNTIITKTGRNRISRRN